MRISAEDYQISFGEHKGKQVLWLAFPYERRKVAAVKDAGAKWSNTQKCWYLYDIARNREALSLKPAGIGKEAVLKMAPVNLSLGVMKARASC